MLDVSALTLDGGGNGLTAAPEGLAVRFAAADGTVENQSVLEMRCQNALEFFSGFIGIPSPVGDV